MNLNDDLLEEYYCIDCGHKWYLLCWEGITNKMRINWLNKVEEEHRRIHEENNYWQNKQN